MSTVALSNMLGIGKFGTLPVQAKTAVAKENGKNQKALNSSDEAVITDNNTGANSDISIEKQQQDFRDSFDKELKENAPREKLKITNSQKKDTAAGAHTDNNDVKGSLASQPVIKTSPANVTHIKIKSTLGEHFFVNHKEGQFLKADAKPATGDIVAELKSSTVTAKKIFISEAVASVKETVTQTQGASTEKLEDVVNTYPATGENENIKKLLVNTPQGQGALILKQNEKQTVAENLSNSKDAPEIAKQADIAGLKMKSDEKPEPAQNQSNPPKVETDGKKTDTVSINKQSIEQKEQLFAQSDIKEQQDKSGDNSPAQKLNARISVKQTKNQSASSFTGNTGSNTDRLGQMLAANEGQVSVTQQGGASTTMAKTGGDSISAEFSEHISEQIQGSVSNSLQQGQSEVTVRLNPPELGRVFIKFQQENGQLTALLEFSRPETRAQVQQLLPQVISNLQESGITIKRFEVVQSQIDNSQQDGFKENLLQEGSSEQEPFSAHHQAPSGYPGDWFADNNGYFNSEPQEISVGDQSINMLV